MQMNENYAQMDSILRARISELHEIAPGSIGDQMCYELIGYDPTSDEYTMRCKTFDWMRNGPGTLHGGMCATIVDQAMGFVAYCMKPGDGIAPTIQMSTTYHRPLLPGENVIVRVSILSKTKSLMNLSAQAYRETQPNKICLSASATYFYKAISIDSGT